MTSLPAPLLVVTDRHQARQTLPQLVAQVVAAGAGWIWMRDRDLDPVARRDLAQALRRTAACLSIGGDVDLAAAVGADGVHLGSAAEVAAARRRLGPRILIGVSAHGPDEVRAAAAAAADYVTLSPIFASASKPGYGPPLGPEAIRGALPCGLPIMALGGVTAARAESCLTAGATGIAVMGEVMRAADPALAVGEILRALAAGTPSARAGHRHPVA